MTESEFGFNVPPTTRSYGDGPQFKISSERLEKRGGGGGGGGRN